MKQRKQIMIDERIFDSLKAVNSSALINSLLTEYFNDSSVMTLDKIRNQITEKTNDMQTLQAVIDELREREQDIVTHNNRVKDIFKDLPMDVLHDFKAFPNMTIEILKIRYRDIYSKMYDITYDELLNAFKEYKGV